MTTISKTNRSPRKPAIAQALEKATAKAQAEQALAKAGNPDDAKAREKAHEQAMRTAAKNATRPIMEGAAVTNHELEQAGVYAARAKVTWFDAVTKAFKAKAWLNLSSEDYDSYARRIISEGVASAFRTQAPGNHKVYRSEAKVIAMAAANGVSSKGKTYNERVQQLRDALKAKGLLGEHKNDKAPDKRVPRTKETGHKADAQAAADAKALAGQVKTFDRPLTERLLAMTPIGDYAAFLVSLCLDEPAKVRAFLDTLKD